MKITLEKNGKSISYNTGTAYYLLLAFIPVFGSIVLIAMTIIRKQFRGIFVNQLLLAIIASFIGSLIYVTGNQTILTIYSTLVTIFYAVVFLMYVFKANQFSVKQRLAEGYQITSVVDGQTEVFLSQVENAKRPFWQLLKF